MKQNITRDIEVKNNLAIIRGEWGGNSVERVLQELLCRTQGQNQEGELRWGRHVALAGVGSSFGKIMQTTLIE